MRDFGLCFSSALVWAAAFGLCSAETLPLPTAQDAALKIFAVHIERTPKQPWPGYGVYLGNGYVLTAAHVVGSPLFTQPRVTIGGKTLSSKIVREGWFEGDDLTVLRVEDIDIPPVLRQRHIILCPSEPPLGSPVVVATPEATARSRIVLPRNISASVLSRFPTLIGDVAATGNSGSGVFDAGSQCLLGIMSRKISLVGHIFKNGQSIREIHDVAKYFVPSTLIAKAIPSTVKF